MNQKKKRVISLVAVILVVAMVVSTVALSLTGCGKAQSAPDKTVTDTDDKAGETDKNVDEGSAGQSDYALELQAEVDALLAKDMPLEAAQLILDAISAAGADSEQVKTLQEMYNSLDRCVIVTEMKSEYWDYEYDTYSFYDSIYSQDGLCVSDVSSEGRIDYEYDANNRLIRRTGYDPDGNNEYEETYGYDEKGRNVNSTYNNFLTGVFSEGVYEYDDNDNATMAKYTDNQGEQLTIEEYYPSGMSKKRTTEYNGADYWYQTIWEFDEEGNVTHYFNSDEYGVTDEYYENLYSSDGTFRQIIRANGEVIGDNSTLRVLDDQDREIFYRYSMSAPDNYQCYECENEYDDAGNVTRYATFNVSAEGERVPDSEYIYEYDELGRCIKVTAKSYGELFYAEETTYNPDGSSKTIRTEEDGTVNEYEYDWRGFLLRELYDTEEYVYEVDALGRRLSTTVNGEVTFAASFKYHYDPKYAVEDTQY